MAETAKQTKRTRWPWLIALAIGLGVAWIHRPDGQLRIAFLNTPGEAILIQTPDGEALLIDGGSDPALLALQLGQRLPFWKRDLDALVLTKPESSHLNGQVAAMVRYQPRLILAPQGVGNYGVAGEWRRLIDLLGPKTRPLREGTRLNLVSGASLEVLGIAEGDEGGAVLLIRYGKTRVLIHSGGPLGDVAASRVAGQAVQVLVYPWQRELDTPLIHALKPKALVFSSSYEASTPALLSYGERRNYSPGLYHEKNDGTIQLISDGQRAWIETEN